MAFLAVPLFAGTPTAAPSPDAAEPAVSPIEAPDTQVEEAALSLEMLTGPLPIMQRAPVGDCGEAGSSCTSDSDCCEDLGCTDASNGNPNTCQAIAIAAPYDPAPKS